MPRLEDPGRQIFVPFPSCSSVPGCNAVRRLQETQAVAGRFADHQPAPGKVKQAVQLRRDAVGIQLSALAILAEVLLFQLEKWGFESVTPRAQGFKLFTETVYLSPGPRPDFGISAQVFTVLIQRFGGKS